jgi:hypothetical protein
MKLEGPVVPMRMINMCKTLTEEDSYNLGDLGVHEKIIGKWILQKQDVKEKTELNWFQI